MARDRRKPAQRPAYPERLAGYAAEALDSLLPADCVDCHRRIRNRSPRPSTPLCPDCEAALPWWRRIDGCPRCGGNGPEDAGLDETGAACPRCLAAGSPLHRCTSLLRYEGPVMRWIPGFKRGVQAFGPPLAPTRVIDFLSRTLATRLIARGEALGLDCLIPVPSHPLRQLRRGFEPALWIAERLARNGAIPLVTGALRRVRSTRPQASLVGEARQRNMRHAFRPARKIERDLRIGLVDDVLTTGATLEAAADVLIEAGAWEVHAITLAATVPSSARAPRLRHPRSD